MYHQFRWSQASLVFLCTIPETLFRREGQLFSAEGSETVTGTTEAERLFVFVCKFFFDFGFSTLSETVLRDAPT
jgi:hypothetical protein